MHPPTSTSTPSSLVPSPSLTVSASSDSPADSIRQSTFRRGTSCDGDPQVRLTARQQQEIVERINATVDDVLDSMVGDGPSTTYWRPKGRKKGIAYFVDDNVNPDQYRFCCVSETDARTEDLMQLFMASDTDSLLRNNRVVYNNILEAQVLGVLEKPRPGCPFKSLYLRYTSYEAPRPLSDRDLCVVVATDVFTHDDGSMIGYCLWDSVEIPECPDYGKSRGLLRSRMFRSGFFCRTTRNDTSGSMTTKVVYLVGMEPGGAAAPRFAAWLLMEKFGANLDRLCSYFRRRRLDPTTFRARHEWPSARNARQCRGCTKPFNSPFTKRDHCVACGEVFCRPCHTKESVDLPGVGITSVRLCLNCLGIRGIHHRTPTNRSGGAAAIRLHRSTKRNVSS